MRTLPQLQIIVCANGRAGINFEHTGVDGHTVLRFAAGKKKITDISICFIFKH